MSHPSSEEPDPLLAFFMEPAVPAPPTDSAEPAVQPADTSPVVTPPSQSPIVTQPETDRVERIERELERSRHELLSLTSQVATLVGAVADMNKRMSRPAVPQFLPRPVLPRLRPRTVSAIGSVVIGFILAAATWRYWPSGDAAIAAPVDQAAIAAAPAAAQPPPAPPPPPPANEVKEDSSPEPTAIKSTNAATPIHYVGTLSIDASPGGQIFIDRKPAGRTPLRVRSLRAGSHLIWIEREGYRRWTRVVQVQADRVSRVSAELEPMASR